MIREIWQMTEPIHWSSNRLRFRARIVNVSCAWRTCSIRTCPRRSTQITSAPSPTPRLRTSATYLRAHEPCVVKSDLKDRSLTIEAWTSDPRAKLLDFGIARLRNLRAKRLRGTIRWMAPEVQGGLAKPMSSVDVFFRNASPSSSSVCLRTHRPEARDRRTETGSSGCSWLACPCLRLEPKRHPARAGC